DVCPKSHACARSCEKKAASYTSTWALVMRRATNGNARAAMDAGSQHRLASAPLKNAKQGFSGGYHEVVADRIVAVDRAAGSGAAVGAQHPLRVHPQSASPAAQHVFRRSLWRLGQFQGPYLALSRGNTSGPAYAAAATQLLEFDA